MSCLRPLKVVNPRYKKTGAKPISFTGNHFLDEYYIYAPCGLCINCLKRRSSEWRIRLINEIQYMKLSDRKNVRVLTLTVSPEYYSRVSSDPSKYIRRFLERYRRKYKVSVKHWITNEYGDEHDRLHFHGIFFDLKTIDIDELSALWKYGFVWIQTAPLGRIVYITKYITKCVKSGQLFIDKEHKPFTWCSPGIGKAFTTDPINIANSHAGGKLITQMSNMHYSYQLPRYYKNKLFTKSELLSIRLDFKFGLQLKQTFSINKKQFTNPIDYYDYLNANFKYIPVDIENHL